MTGVQKTFALIVGIVLLIVGIWGIFLPGGEGEILGLFGVNTFQSILHIIAGLFGLYVGIKGQGPGFNLTIGWIGIALGVLGFIPWIKDLLADLLSINTEITILHLVIGIIALIVYYSAEK